MSVEHQSGLPSVQPLCLLRKEFFKTGTILYGKEAQKCHSLEILSCDDLCGTLGGPFVDPWEARGGPLEDPRRTLGGSLEDPWWTLGGPWEELRTLPPRHQGCQGVYTRTSA